MKKVLTIISISAGIVSIVSAVVLCCIPSKNVVGHLKKAKTKSLFSKK